MKIRIFCLLSIMMLLFVFMSCGDSSSSDSKNPLIGTWIGTVKVVDDSSNTPYPCVLIITETDTWRITCESMGILEEGTVSRSGNKGNLQQSGVTLATVEVSNGKLTLNVNMASLKAKGEFTL